MCYYFIFLFDKVYLYLYLNTIITYIFLFVFIFNYLKKLFEFDKCIEPIPDYSTIRGLHYSTIRGQQEAYLYYVLLVLGGHEWEGLQSDAVLLVTARSLY